MTPIYSGVPIDSPSFTTKTTTTGAANLSATNLFTAVSADGTNAVAIGQDTVRAAGSQTNQNLVLSQKAGGNVVLGLGSTTYVDNNGKIFANAMRIDGTDTSNTIYNPNGSIGIVGSAVAGLHVIGTTGVVTFDAPVRLKGYTVATLPSGTVGDTAYVTDATAPTYNGALTGGGAIKVPVFYNGSAWVSH